MEAIERRFSNKTITRGTTERRGRFERRPIYCFTRRYRCNEENKRVTVRLPLECQAPFFRRTRVSTLIDADATHATSANDARDGREDIRSFFRIDDLTATGRVWRRESTREGGVSRDSSSDCTGLRAARARTR